MTFLKKKRQLTQRLPRSFLLLKRDEVYVKHYFIHLPIMCDFFFIFFIKEEWTLLSVIQFQLALFVKTLFPNRLIISKRRVNSG